MAAIDVHRLLGSWIAPRNVTSVAQYDMYVAIVDGEELKEAFELGASADAVANHFKNLVMANPENAAPEGGEIQEPPEQETEPPQEGHEHDVEHSAQQRGGYRTTRRKR